MGRAFAASLVVLAIAVASACSTYDGVDEPVPSAPADGGPEASGSFAEAGASAPPPDGGAESGAPTDGGADADAGAVFVDLKVFISQSQVKGHVGVSGA